MVDWFQTSAKSRRPLANLRRGDAADCRAGCAPSQWGARGSRRHNGPSDVALAATRAPIGQALTDETPMLCCGVLVARTGPAEVRHMIFGKLVSRKRAPSSLRRRAARKGRNRGSMQLWLEASLADIDAGRRPLACDEKLSSAGAGGFEPPHGGIKSLRHPLITIAFWLSCCTCVASNARLRKERRRESLFRRIAQWLTQTA